MVKDKDKTQPTRTEQAVAQLDNPTDTSVNVPTTNDLVKMQAPALAGAPEVEIAKRTADNDGAVVDTKFRKTFVILPVQNVDSAHAVKPEDDTQAHEARKLAVLEQAIQLGLHPDTEATFDGAEQHPDGVSVCLNYSVAVTPASVDKDPNTVTPSRVLNERLDGSTSNAEAHATKAEVTREKPQPTE